MSKILSIIFFVLVCFKSSWAVSVDELEEELRILYGKFEELQHRVELLEKSSDIVGDDNEIIISQMWVGCMFS